MDVFKEKDIISYENVAEATNLLKKSLARETFAIRFWDFKNKSQITEDYGEHFSRALSQNLTQRKKIEIPHKKSENSTPKAKKKEDILDNNTKHFHIVDHEKKPFRKHRRHLPSEGNFKRPDLKNFKLFDDVSIYEKRNAISNSPDKGTKNISKTGLMIENFKESLKNDLAFPEDPDKVSDYISRLKQTKTVSTRNLLEAVKKQILVEGNQELTRDRDETKCLTTRPSYSHSSSESLVVNPRQFKGGSLANSYTGTLKDACKIIAKSKSKNSPPDQFTHTENASYLASEFYSSRQLLTARRRCRLQERMNPKFTKTSSVPHLKGYLFDYNLHHSSQSPAKTFLTSVPGSSHPYSIASTWASTSHSPSKRRSLSPNRSSEINCLNAVIVKCGQLEENTKQEKQGIKEIGQKIGNDIESLEDKLTEREPKFKKSYIKHIVDDFNVEKRAFIYGRKYQGRYISGHMKANSLLLDL
ncbi:unnamed protein product [Blepharisma stoltei]|uniref:Uncharacterized protein n=1 Tax=Blepharisma stoltei TaxID=1481888 RepID=A0AAU9IL78_9CILI|nr:unnamed protein product [Blepharisma stoltei]